MLKSAKLIHFTAKVSFSDNKSSVTAERPRDALC